MGSINIFYQRGEIKLKSTVQAGDNPEAIKIAKENVKSWNKSLSKELWTVQKVEKVIKNEKRAHLNWFPVVVVLIAIFFIYLSIK